MSGFDPIALATSIREGLYLTIDRPAEDFDAGMRGRVAAFAVEAIVSAWLVGERDRVAGTLDRTTEWLQQSDAELGDTDAEGWFGVERRRRGLAVARWLGGEDPRPAAAGAARAGAMRSTTEPPEAPYERADHLTDWLLAGDAASAIAAARAHPPPADDIAAAAALHLAKAQRGGGGTVGVDVLASVGAMLGQVLATWLDGGAYSRIARWCRLVFWDTGLAGDSESALLMMYVFLPGIAVSPALVARGWQAGVEQAVVTLSSTALLPRVDGLARVVGLARDADAVRQDAEKPAFASWTAPAPDDREIDWHDENDDCWLEVRGRDAGVLAGALAAALPGRIGRDPDAALAERITVPPGTGRAGLGGQGALRWTVLRQAIAAAVPENARAVNMLITAGLADPDWRVRMTAVLAVGRLRLAALADKTLAAPVPEAGRDGLGQEDRRMLLALRQAAHDRAAGIPPQGEAADPAVAARRQAFQARLQAQLAMLPDASEDRADALLLGLLGGRAALKGRVPGTWNTWLDAAAPVSPSG